MIKNLMILLVGLCIGLFLSAWTGSQVLARFADQCGPTAMMEMRMYSAECVADGSAPMDCVERAKVRYCR